MRYLSLDWIDAMQAQVASSESLTDLASTHSIGVTQVVTDGPEGSVLYHLQVGNGVANFAPGPAPDEDVRMEQTWETAVGVATGSLPAQEALILFSKQQHLDNLLVHTLQKKKWFYPKSLGSHLLA